MGGEHPIVYIRRVLIPPENNCSTTDKEMLALLYAIRKTGHLGVQKIYNRIARNFYWPGIYNDKITLKSVWNVNFIKSRVQDRKD